MRKLVLIVIFLGGVGLCCYPKINCVINNFEVSQSIKQFQTILREIQKNELVAHENSSHIDLDGLFLEFQNYNETLYESKQVDLADPFSYEQASFNLKSYGFENNMVGYLTISKLNLELPIYLGATKENLAKGSVHLSQTSLPIGGNNSNVVIAAHNGWYGKVLFRHLNQLELGDEIQITNFWDTLTYEVVNIEIIKPDDISKVLIQEGKDLVTLMTCHPYGKNTERYLVYAERVKE